jgi:hypothetical protein
MISCGKTPTSHAEMSYVNNVLEKEHASCAVVNGKLFADIEMLKIAECFASAGVEAIIEIEVKS